MRQSPGGHNTTEDSGNNGNNEFWQNAEYQDRLASLWKKIAGRYKNKKIIIGYDLLNEPEAHLITDLNDVYNQIIQKIREVDSNHIIFLEGNDFAVVFEGLDITPDANLALSAHFYWPGSYVVQGTGTYPSPAEGFDYEALENELTDRISFAVNNNIPLWMGEFGAMSCAGNYLDYDQDVITIFEEQGLSWNYWHFKNLKGKTNTQAIYYMNADNTFLKLLQGQAVDESDALEALKTEYFIERTELKLLLEASY
jgi:endoglucanase